MWPLWAVRGRDGIAWKAVASVACSNKASTVAPVEGHQSSRAHDDKREAVMKCSLLGALMLSAILWPVGTYAQTGADPMGKAVKPDDMKWEPLEGGFEISILYTNPTTKATYLVIRGPGNLHVPRH